MEKTPRIWFVEDFYGQTTEWIKAYKTERPGTIRVKEVLLPELLQDYVADKLKEGAENDTAVKEIAEKLLAARFATTKDMDDIEVEKAVRQSVDAAKSLLKRVYDTKGE